MTKRSDAGKPRGRYKPRSDKGQARGPYNKAVVPKNQKIQLRIDDEGMEALNELSRLTRKPKATILSAVVAESIPRLQDVFAQQLSNKKDVCVWCLKNTAVARTKQNDPICFKCGLEILSE